MVSLSAAVPIQDVTESYSVKVPNDLASDSNMDYSVPNGDSAAPQFLAFSSSTASESNWKPDSSILDASNSKDFNAALNLDNLDFSTLYEPLPSVSFGSGPTVPPSDLGILEAVSKNAEEPVVFDSAIPNSLIVAQNPASLCASGKATKTEDFCPNPDLVLHQNIHPQSIGTKDPTHYDDRVIENNDAVKKADDKWLDSFNGHPQDLIFDEDMDKVCRSHWDDANLRPFPFCCFGPELRLIRILNKYIRVTNQGNCVTFFALRPWCQFDPRSWFCCAAGGKPMRWGVKGISCVPMR